MTTIRTRSKPISASARNAPADKMTLRVWLRLLTSAQLIERHIRSLLRREFDTTLPRFDVLAQLDASNGVLSMGELSERLMVTSGNVTGLIDLMEEDGLVERVPHPTDRRSTLIHMTARGETLFSRTVPAHQDWVHEIMADLTGDELRELHRLLGKVKTSALDLRVGQGRGARER